MIKFNLLPKDLLIKIFLKLELPDIYELIRVDRIFNNINNDIFWMNKFHYDYGNYLKVSDVTWKEFYKYITVTKPNDLLWEGVKENVLSYVVVGLKRGADIEDERSYKFLSSHPLSYAGGNGHLEILKYLVEQKANVRAQDDEALRCASENGHIEVVKYLITNGADIRAHNDHALGLASGDGHLEVVKYLVERGANIRAGTDHALTFACFQGHLEIVKYLVERGADVCADHDLPLRDASRYGHLEVVKYLVGQGVDIHTQNDIVLKLASLRGHLEVVKYLLEQGLNINDEILQNACSSKNLELVRYLIMKENRTKLQPSLRICKKLKLPNLI